MSPGRTGRRRSRHAGVARDDLRNPHRPGHPGSGLPGPPRHRAGCGANTLLSYRRDLRRYTEHLAARGIADMREVTETDVSDFLVALRLGDTDTGAVPLSAVSAARALIAVRGLHRSAAAEGIVDVDVARAVKPPTPSRRLPKTSHWTMCWPCSTGPAVTPHGRPADAPQPGPAGNVVFDRCPHLRSRRLGYR